jgi:hypothetical protein
MQSLAEPGRHAGFCLANRINVFGQIEGPRFSAEAPATTLAFFCLRFSFWLFGLYLGNDSRIRVGNDSRIGIGFGVDLCVVVDIVLATQEALEHSKSLSDGRAAGGNATSTERLFKIVLDISAASTGLLAFLAFRARAPAAPISATSEFIVVSAGRRWPAGLAALVSDACVRPAADRSHAEDHSALVGPEIDDLDLDFLILFDHVLRPLDASRGHLADREERFRAFRQLDERAALHNAADRNLKRLADLVVLLDEIPRIRKNLPVPKRNLAGARV